jgi:hypothetical protein
VMAYFHTLRGKFSDILWNTRTPLKTGVGSCSAAGLVGPSFPQTPKFFRGFRHDTWVVRRVTENFGVYKYQCAWQHVWHLSAFNPSYSQETLCGNF